MSIAALEQVQDELRRLAIAGSSLAPGDFRLKKLIPPLEKSGAKAPVFAKVAEATGRLVDGTEKDAPQNLLELSTLVSAVLYTQGATGAAGKLQPLETTELGPLETGTSARVLKPLVEALNSTGSGRLEIVRDAIERGAFRDLRLVNPAIAAIDDPYPEIADLVAEKVLPKFGKPIYSQIREPFDPQGRGGHVRRLKLMHQLDPKATRELVEQSLEGGSKEMKIAALLCLKGSKDGLPHLLDQAGARAQDVRAAAYEGMSEFKDPQVTETFKKALSGQDLSIAAGPASRNPNPALLEFLLAEGRSQLAALFETKTKAKGKAQLGKQVERFQEFLTCFAGRTDKKSVAFLAECFDRREDLARLPASFDPEAVVWKVANLLCYTNAKPILKKVAAAHETLPPTVLPAAFIAASLTSKPAEVYDTFSPYLRAKGSAKPKRNDPTEARREAIESVVTQAANPDRWWYYHDHQLDFNIADRVADIKLDDRWLDLAVELDEFDLVVTLLRPGHRAAGDYLAGTVRELLKRRDLDWHLMQAMESLMEVGHPRASELYFEMLEKFLGPRTQRPYFAYWLGRLIPSLPKEAAADLEAMLPRLNEHAVDTLAGYVVELKAKK